MDADSFLPLLDVRVAGGVLRGTRDGDLKVWRGIPYAAPPVGDLRFRAPQQVIPWDGVRDSSTFGPIAPQKLRAAFSTVAAKPPQSEDCLTLNVSVKDDSVSDADADTGVDADADADADADGGAPKPVMVFIHGGAYRVGAGSHPWYRGESLVRRGDVVYVTFNYRLGALGYMDFTQYNEPDDEKPRFETNVGLRDQVAALQWVRDNIRAFGGDPENVTLFGQSSGGNAVTTLMAAPAAKGLFARAIAESPPPNAVYESRITALWAAELVGILGGTKDTAADILTNAEPMELFEAVAKLMKRTPDEYPGAIALCPVVDADFLPELPVEAFKNGLAHRVPLIIGTNANEGTLFTGHLDILARTQSRANGVLKATSADAATRLLGTYSGFPSREAGRQFSADYAFWLGAVLVAGYHSRYASVRMYRFDFAPRLMRWAGLGATHGLEMYALFDLIDTWLARLMTLFGGRRKFRLVSRRVQRYWLQFARQGKVRSWPLYDEKSRKTLIVDARERVEFDPHRERRQAWQEYVFHL